MPIWLRRYTFEKLKEYYDKQQQEQEKQSNMMTNKGNKDIAKPNISQPTYTAKVPKK
jgi:hypothetical protein